MELQTLTAGAALLGAVSATGGLAVAVLNRLNPRVSPPPQPWLLEHVQKSQYCLTNLTGARAERFRMEGRTGMATRIDAPDTVDAGAHVLFVAIKAGQGGDWSITVRWQDPRGREQVWRSALP